jgi:hypothetical protein
MDLATQKIYIPLFTNVNSGVRKMPKTPKMGKNRKEVTDEWGIDEVYEKFGEWCNDPENEFDEACERLFDD